jgi:hypothetical protein
VPDVAHAGRLAQPFMSSTPPDTRTERLNTKAAAIIAVAVM